MDKLEEYVINHSCCTLPRCEYVENDIEIECDECQKRMLEEHEKKIRAEAIKELLMPYDVESIEDLIKNVKNKAVEEFVKCIIQQSEEGWAGMTIDMKTIKRIKEQLKDGTDT